MRAISKLLDGWDYHFTGRAPQDSGQVARRATLDQFQTFPVNSIQGRGTLVSQNNAWGQKYFNVIQPPQVLALQTGVNNDLFDAGTQVTGLYGTSLLPNPASTGIS